MSVRRPGEIAPDVLVAGAGPAGSSAAIAIARAGWSVLLADPCVGHAPAFKIGETMPAVAAAALRDLGIPVDGLAPAGALASTGTSSAWGAGPPLERTAIADPTATDGTSIGCASTRCCAPGLAPPACG